MENTMQATVLRLIFCFQILANVYKTEAAVSSCNAQLRGNSGTFTSPNYPNPPNLPSTPETLSYPDNRGLITCQWQIEVPAGKGIQLKFGDFDMKASLDDCDKGEVVVFSGINKQKTILDEYCPGNNPDTVTLLDNTATVVFRRPSTFIGRGFLISYIAISPGKTIDDFVTCSHIGHDHAEVNSFSVMCPSGCGNIKSHKIWGSLKYRDNSHLCRAAVHAGVISDQFGGMVRVRRKLGAVLYYGSEANNVTALTGAMSDSQINFPDLQICHEDIKIVEKQFSASSFWNTTDAFNRIQVWLPGKAILTGLSEAWSPADYTKTQWLQVDLGKVMNLTGIVTRGSSKPYTYTKSFTIKYSLNNITWHSYKERGYRRAKVFTGNTNFFGQVRNNFVEPTIITRHIRIYPTAIPSKDREHLRYGLKVGLLGCEIGPSSLVPPNLSPVTRKPSRKPTFEPTPPLLPTTTLATTTPGQSEKDYNEKEATTWPDVKNTESLMETMTTTSSNSTVPINNDDQDRTNSIDVNPNVESANLNDRSILVIVIVSALAATAIFLAVLVFVLVRKRKKDPKIEANFSRPNVQANVAYDTRIGMVYHNCNNNDGSIAPNKLDGDQLHRDPSFNCGHHKDNRLSGGISRQESLINSRGGITLQYDQQQTQPLLNGDAVFRNESIGQARTSYSIHSDVTNHKMLLPDSNKLLDTAVGSFLPDFDDHEYQVIPEHVQDFNDHTNNISSKTSTVSSDGTRSKTSDSNSWKKGAIWGTAGDAWGKDASPGSRSSYKNRNMGHSPHRSSSTGPRNSSQRYSSSSGGSSFQSPFDVTSGARYDPATCSSVSEANGNGAMNSNIHPLQKANSFGQPRQKPRKASYNVPSSIPVESSLPIDNATAHRQPNQSTTFPNGLTNRPSLGHSNSRSKSLKQAKVRNEYDHLYRGKAISKPVGDRCVVDMTINDYSKLDLNTAV